MPGPRAGKSENGFSRCGTWLQIFQNDSKICEAEVIVTPLINKICNPWVKQPLTLFILSGYLQGFTLVPEVFLEIFRRKRESQPQINSLSPLRGSLSLSQRKISRKTSGTWSTGVQLCYNQSICFFFSEKWTSASEAEPLQLLFTAVVE